MKTQKLTSFFTPPPSTNNSSITKRAPPTPNWGSLVNKRKHHFFCAYKSFTTDVCDALASHIQQRPRAYVSTKYEPIFLQDDRVSGCGSYRCGEMPTNESPSFDNLRSNMFGTHFLGKPVVKCYSTNITHVLAWSQHAMKNTETLNIIFESLTPQQQQHFSLIYYGTSSFLKAQRLLDEADHGTEEDLMASLSSMAGLVELVTSIDLGSDNVSSVSLIAYLQMFNVETLVSVVSRHQIST